MEDRILATRDNVQGEIYRICNKNNGKCYIGQTLTHRLNHGKYRPYGHTRRFASHVSEALMNTKKGQCSGIADAIRKFGKDAFEVTLLCRCDTKDLDDKESEMIALHNTLFPNGYNLAKGGRNKVNTTEYVSGKVSIRESSTVRTNAKSEATKQLISRRLHEFHKHHKDQADANAQRSKDKWMSKKLHHFKGVNINTSAIDSYIKVHGERCVVEINDKYASFASKFDSLDIKKQKARAFLQEIIKMNLK